MYLVVDNNIVLGSHVVGNIVIHDQAKQAVEKGQVNLLVHLLKPGLHHHIALSLPRLPHILEVVDAWGSRQETEHSN